MQQIIVSGDAGLPDTKDRTPKLYLKLGALAVSLLTVFGMAILWVASFIDAPNRDWSNNFWPAIGMLLFSVTHGVPMPFLCISTYRQTASQTFSVLAIVLCSINILANILILFICAIYVTTSDYCGSYWLSYDSDVCASYKIAAAGGGYLSAIQCAFLTVAVMEQRRAPKTVKSQSDTSTTVIQSQPMMMQSQPMIIQTQPMMMQSQPMMMQSQPMMMQSQPMIIQSQPMMIQSQPMIVTM